MGRLRPRHDQRRLQNGVRVTVQWLQGRARHRATARAHQDPTRAAGRSSCPFTVDSTNSILVSVALSVSQILLNESGTQALIYCIVGWSIRSLKRKTCSCTEEYMANVIRMLAPHIWCPPHFALVRVPALFGRASHHPRKREPLHNQWGQSA